RGRSPAPSTGCTPPSRRRRPRRPPGRRSRGPVRGRPSGGARRGPWFGGMLFVTRGGSFAVSAASPRRCKPVTDDTSAAGGASLAGRVPRLASAQERPHLVRRVAPVPPGGPHRGDPPPPGPVGDGALGHLEQEGHLTGPEQPPP